VTTSQVGVITAVTDADDTDTDPQNGIDNYTLFFVTDSREFDRALSGAGVKIDRDRRMSLAIDRDPASATATVTASVHRQPRYDLAGTQSDATVPFGTFVADWWSDRGNDRIRIRTTFPDITFGFGGEETAAVTLTTGNGSRLARLADTDQIVFDTSLRGSFPRATLVVEPAQIGDG
jgi:hypothetical protein